MSDFPDPASFLNAAYSSRSPEEIWWIMSSAYVRGIQNISQNAKTSMLSIRALESGRSFLVSNKLLPAYRTNYARLAVDIPSIRVGPGANTTEDIAKAEACQIAGLFHWRNEEMTHKTRKIIRIGEVKGTAAYHTYFDKGKDKVCTDVIRPEDLLIEAGITSLEEASFYGVRRVCPRSEVIKSFPEHEEMIRDTSAYQPQPGAYGITANAGPANVERIEVHDIYWTDKRYAMVAGRNNYLFTGERHTPKVPIRICRYTTIDDYIWGLSMVLPAIDLQDQLNILRTLTVESARLTAFPRYQAPTTANVSSVKSAPGSLTKYNALGGKIEPFPVAPMPEYAQRIQDRLEADIADDTSAHNAGLGKRVVGMASGAGVQALATNDASALQMTMDDIEFACAGVCQDAIALMAKFYAEPRMVAMFDVQGKWVSRSIKSTDLFENPEVIIEAGSLFRANSSDREKRVLDLLKAGLIDKDEALAEIDQRTYRRRAEQRAQQIDVAHRSLKAVLAGHDIQILASDNIPVMTDVFNEFVQGEDFIELAPQIRAKLSEIVRALAAPPDPSVNETGLIYPRPPVRPAPPPAPSPTPRAAPGLPGSQGVASAIPAGADQFPQISEATEPDTESVHANAMGPVG